MTALWLVFGLNPAALLALGEFPGRIRITTLEDCLLSGLEKSTGVRMLNLALPVALVGLVAGSVIHRSPGVANGPAEG